MTDIPAEDNLLEKGDRPTTEAGPSSHTSFHAENSDDQETVSDDESFKYDGNDNVTNASVVLQKDEVTSQFQREDQTLANDIGEDDEFFVYPGHDTNEQDDGNDNQSTAGEDTDKDTDDSHFVYTGKDAVLSVNENEDEDEGFGELQEASIQVGLPTSFLPYGSA
jgi:hypothetical protein